MPVLYIEEARCLKVNTYIFSSYLTEKNVCPLERPISELFFEKKNRCLLPESYEAHKHIVTGNKQRFLTRIVRYI